MLNAFSVDYSLIHLKDTSAKLILNAMYVIKC